MPLRSAPRIWPLAGRSLNCLSGTSFLNNILKRVVLGSTSVTIEIDKTKLLATLLAENPEALASLRTHKSDILALTSAFGALRRGSKLRLVTPQNGSGFEQTPVTSLANAIARARDWYERIVAGDVNTVGQLARSAGLDSAIRPEDLAVRDSFAANHRGDLDG